MLSRRLMGGSGKLRIASPAASPAGHDDPLVGSGKVVDFFSSFVVIKNRADWDFKEDVGTLFAGAVGAFSVASALRRVFRVEAEVHQSVVALAGFHDDVAATAAIAARRAAARDVLLAPESEASVAAVTGLYANFGFIYEHGLESRRWLLVVG